MHQSIVNVHTAADGRIWYASEAGLPQLYLPGSSELAERLRNSSNGLVRVLGCRHNAQLICDLYAALYSSRRLQLGSPAACTTRRELYDPVRTLYAMRRWHYPASVGGWHNANPDDFINYHLVRLLQAGQRYTTELRPLLVNHPAWAALSFITNISESYAAWLLTTVLDPRWYVDPEHPDRTTRLQAYMGMRPDIQKIVSDHGTVRSRREAHCRIVFGVWSVSGQPDADTMQAPGSFLWRVRQAAGGGVKGDLRASQRLLLYLRSTWLAALYRDKGYDGGRSLFVPSAFFKTADEISGYREHMYLQGIQV